MTAVCASQNMFLQLRLRNDDLARRTTVARQTAAARKQRMLEKQERLQEACGSSGPLAACLQQAKEQRLCYPDLLHTWRHTHGLLVTRRHQLVISLFHHFRLQPAVCFVLMLSVLQQLWDNQRMEMISKPTLSREELFCSVPQ